MAPKERKKRLFVIFAAGKDRPGIAAGLTEALYRTGCNIEDSTMTLLKGEFSIILTVTASSKLAFQTLEKEIQKVAERLSLYTSVKKVSHPPFLKNSKGVPYRITLYGTDHPGIVYGVTKYLAQKKINVIDLQTKSIPQKKGTLYSMVIEVDIPKQRSVKQVGSDLQSIAKKLRVTLDFDAIDVVTL
ncbi:MAG: amino acid-binding protein [Deltaproteobacteria bacterium]|nr:amino acid-binding protein [Deltaproteobacteria bacterium]